MTGPTTADGFEHDFARRAAVYLREQGLTEEEIQEALVAELGTTAAEAEALATPKAA